MAGSREQGDGVQRGCRAGSRANMLRASEDRLRTVEEHAGSGVWLARRVQCADGYGSGGGRTQQRARRASRGG